MRASLLVGVIMIALLVLGIRAQRRHAEVVMVSDVAYAQPAPGIGKPMAPVPPNGPEAPKAPEAPKRNRAPQVLISRGPQTPSVWKTEVVGDPKTTAEAARRDALIKAADKLAEWVDDRFPGFKYRPTPKFLVDNRLVDETPVEERTLANADAPTMFVQKVNLELGESQLAQLLQEDRRERSVDRLWQGGRILGGVVIVLLALIGYVRLDDWTKGYFSMALKLSAVALAVAGIVILLMVA